MKRNISNIDKGIRVVIALLVAVLYFTGVISGTLAIIFGIVAIVLLLTAFLNFCPIWAALGINTFKKDKKIN